MAPNAPMADLVERMARAMHASLARSMSVSVPSVQCRAVRWDELDDEQRAWMLTAAQHVIDELGMTQEFAVRLEWENPARSIVLDDPADIRAARKFHTDDVTVVDVDRWATRWERTDG